MFPSKSSHKHWLSGSLLGNSGKGCSRYGGADLIPRLNYHLFLSNLAVRVFKISISKHSVSHLNVSFAYGKHTG